MNSDEVEHARAIAKRRTDGAVDVREMVDRVTAGPARGAAVIELIGPDGTVKSREVTNLITRRAMSITRSAAPRPLPRRRRPTSRRSTGSATWPARSASRA